MKHSAKLGTAALLVVGFKAISAQDEVRLAFYLKMAPRYMDYMEFLRKTECKTDALPYKQQSVDVVHKLYTGSHFGLIKSLQPD